MKLTKITTESDSIYWIDQDLQLIRREGSAEGYGRVSDEWRRYQGLYYVGEPTQLLIVWPDDVELLPETQAAKERWETENPGKRCVPASQSTAIVSVEEVEPELN